MSARDKLNHLMVMNNVYRRSNAEMLERIDRRDAEMELAQLSDVATDFGRITAGQIDVADGASVLDDDGQTFLADTAYGASKSLKWETADGFLAGYINGRYQGSAPNRGGVIVIEAYDEPLGDGSGAAFSAIGAGTALAINSFTFYAQSAPYFRYQDIWGNTGKPHYGDYGAPVLVDTASKTTVYTRSVKQSSIGANGLICDLIIPFRLLNNSGGAKTFTFTIDWGGTSWTIVATALATGANPRYGSIRLIMRNYKNVAVQHAETELIVSAASAIGTAVARGGAVNDTQGNNATEDTGAANKTLTVSITLSGAGQGATYNAETGVPLTPGPYYSA